MSLRAPCPANWMTPIADGEEEEHAGHGEEGQKAEDQRLGLLAAEVAQADDRPDQHAGQQQTQPDMAGRSDRSIAARPRRIALLSHGV